MEFGFGGQLPPGLAGGKTVVSARSSPAAQLEPPICNHQIGGTTVGHLVSFPSFSDLNVSFLLVSGKHRTICVHNIRTVKLRTIRLHNVHTVQPLPGTTSPPV